MRDPRVKIFSARIVDQMESLELKVNDFLRGLKYNSVYKVDSQYYEGRAVIIITHEAQ